MTKESDIVCSNGIGYVAFVPRVWSDVSPTGARSEDVPIHIGLVRFGGMSVKLGFVDSATRVMMPIGRLYPSTRERS